MKQIINNIQNAHKCLSQMVVTLNMNKDINWKNMINSIEDFYGSADNIDDGKQLFDEEELVNLENIVDIIQKMIMEHLCLEKLIQRLVID